MPRTPTSGFTLSHGIVNEVYFPHVDTPNIRDLQFLVTDEETFGHEEKRDLLHEIAHPEKTRFFTASPTRIPRDATG